VHQGRPGRARHARVPAPRRLSPAGSTRAAGGSLVDDDELDDKERAELHAALLAAEAELDAGQAVSEADLWARLRTGK
jgi:hypothetical protein